jgi:hypothetical protein
MGGGAGLVLSARHPGGNVSGPRGFSTSGQGIHGLEKAKAVRRAARKACEQCRWRAEQLEQRVMLSSVVPAGWTDADIGTPGLAGSANFTASSGAWSVAGGGADIGGTSDQFNFASEALSGDGTAIVKVTAVQNTDPAAKAGLMMRATSAAGDLFADVVLTSSNGVSFQWRATASAAASVTTISAVSAPQFLELKRVGTTFTGFYSTNGTTFTQVGTASIASFPTAGLAGLAVTAHNNTVLNTSTFSGLNVTNSPPTAATAAAATPNPPTGNTATMSVLGADLAGESNLTYTWATTGTPPAAVGFSANGTNAAKSTTATFSAAGTYALQVTMKDQAGFTGISSITIHVPSATLPAGWSDNDIGQPGLAGSAVFNNGNWTITGGGTDIWGSADLFNYASESFTGDAIVVAKVNSVSNADTWSKAGVMLRASSAANSAFADVLVTPGQGVAFQWRASAGAGGNNQQVTNVHAPQWVKLGKFGNSFYGFYSSDGINWTQIGSSAQVSMGSSELAGLAVSAHNNALISTAAFSNFSAVANAAPAIVTAAAANPNPLAGYSTNLSVLANDDGGESNVTYTWSLVGTPPAPVTFSTNAKNASKNTTATFSLSGTYNFLVTMTDVAGLSTTSSVSVNASVPPLPPTGVSPILGASSVSLSWLAPARAVSYNIYRGTATSAEGATPYASGITATTFTDNAITAGQQYFYQVSAVDSSSLESTRSFEALASAGAPTTPIISEFMALNSKTLADEDGDHGDWIELFNPTANDINLGGYYLTDKTDNLIEWQIPAATISSGGTLVIFADGKNRADPTKTLHTNFSLSGSGEYVALVAPDQTTILSAYTFGPQVSDVAYGVGVSEATVPLVPTGAPTKVLVPTDGSLGTSWTSSGFSDSTWTSGATGVGYETETAIPNSPGFSVRMVDTQGGTNGAVSDIGVATALLNGTTAPGAFAVVFDGTVDRPVINMGDGGNYANDMTLPNGLGGSSADNTQPGRTDYALRITAYVVIPAGQYTLDVNSDDGFRLTIPGVIFTNRVNENFAGGATNPSPANTLVYGGTRGASDTLGTFTVPTGGLTTTLTLDEYEHTGGDEVEFAVASNQQAAYSSTAFSLLGNGVLGWQVLDPSGSYTPNYASLIGTNTQSQMFNTGKNTAYIRIPFTVSNPSTLGSVRFRIKYDDGFVAYINGLQVAQSNAPTPAIWSSSATAAHPDTAALNYQTISIPASDLVAGNNVLAIQGLNFATDQSDFLIYPILDNLIVSLGAQGFLTPTPNAVNGQIIATGIVDEPTFSQPHGIYNSPFQLSITDTTPGAQIRYTLDGSTPSSINGTLYTGPIAISGETDIRAAAFLAGDLPSAANTATYIFISDVLQQQPNGQPPAGWPSSWGLSVEHYGMDPRVVNDPQYSGEIAQDLLDVPSFSLTMNLADLFDPLTGIYANSSQSGPAWERPGSIELMNPNGVGGFQANAGVRIHGGASSFNPDAKHGFRIIFGSQYGPSELDYPLFGAGGATTYKEFDLRTDQNNSWQYSNSANFTGNRDQFSSATAAAEGQPAEHFFNCYLYINGIFWGLYDAIERTDADYAASYYGGTSADYDVIKSNGPDGNWNLEATDGTMNAWSQLFNDLTTLDLTSNANYELIQGNNPDGSRNSSYSNLLDVDNLIDYMLLIYYTGNLDAPNSNFLSNLRPNNFYGIRPIDGSWGFRFVPHDSEWTLLSATQNRVNTAATPTLLTSNPGWFFQQLEPNALFRMKVADHIQKQFFNGGPLSVAGATATFNTWMNAVSPLTVPESARWGDVLRPTQPYTRNVEWQAEINRLETTYLPTRTATVIGQLSAVNLFPSVAAPTYNQFGGTVPSGFVLTLANPNSGGSIYYTINGADPWLPSGAPSPSALLYSGPITISQTTEVKSRIVSGGVWSALSDAVFALSASSIRLTELNYDPPKPPVGSTFNNDDFEFVELKNYGSVPVNLQNIAFTNGINYTFGDVVLAPGQVGVLVNNQSAFLSRYGNGPYILGNYQSTGQNFNNAGERVTLVDASGQTLADFTYGTSSTTTPPWYTTTHGGGPSLDVIAPNSNPDLNNPANWRPSAITNGTPGVDDSIPTGAPTNVTAVGSPNQVSLSWTAVPGATNYNVYRGVAPGGENATPIASGITATTFADTGLSNGITYFYFITATDFGGESPHSAEVWATAGTPLSLNGAAVLLKVENDGLHLDATVNGVLTTYLMSNIGTLSVNGANAGSSLTLDESGGGAVPSVKYVGGTGANSLTVLGAAASETVALDNSSLVFNSATTTTLTNVSTITYTDGGGNDSAWVLGSLVLTLNLGGGADALNVASGSNAIVNMGPSSGDITVNGNGNTVININGGGSFSSNPSAIISAPPAPSGIITGVIYNDTNGNGKRDKNEKGLAGRQVFLDLNHNGKHDKGEAITTTAADGAYHFAHLAPGNYLVREMPVTGWRATTPAALKVQLLNGKTVSGENFGQKRK